MTTWDIDSIEEWVGYTEFDRNHSGLRMDGSSDHLCDSGRGEKLIRDFFIGFSDEETQAFISLLKRGLNKRA